MREYRLCLGSQGTSFEPSMMQLSRKSLRSSAELPIGAPYFGKTSTVATGMNLVTTMVGAGIMSFPALFARAGWIVAPLTLLVMAWVLVVVIIKIGQACRICEERAGTGSQYSFGHVPEKFEDLGEAAMGMPGKRLVSVLANVFMLMMSGAYVILVGSSLEYLSNVLLPYRAWVLLMIVFMAPLCLMDDMALISKLSGLGVLASCLYAIAIASAGMSVAGEIPAHKTAKLVPNTILELGSTIAVMHLAFSCQMVVCTVRSEMASPTELPIATKGATLVVLAVYMIAGCTGFYGFGEDVAGNVLESMRDKVTHTPLLWGMVLAAAVVVNLFVTFPIIMQCVFKAVEKSFHCEYSVPIRLSLFVCTIAVGLFCPFFLEVLSLMGSTVGVTIGVFVPVGIHRQLRKERDTPCAKALDDGTENVKDVLLLCVAILAVVFGTKDAVAGLMTAFGQDGKNPLANFWDPMMG